MWREKDCGRKGLFSDYKVATIIGEGEEETRNSRLQIFFSSIFSSLGGVFGNISQEDNKEQEEEEEDKIMASRTVVSRQQPQTKGEVKQKMVVAEARTRRVLRDIGNLVIDRPVEGKPHPNTSHPAIRNSTQLSSNEKAAGGKNKEVLEIVERVRARKGGIIKPIAAQKNELENPEIEEVIVLSPVADKNHKNNRKSLDASKTRRKNVKTLSSILSARSKAACEFSQHGVELIVNIDEVDADNELAVVEYIDDMHKFYKQAEDENRVHDYMGSQKDINPKMRAILIDWLVEVHRKFELMPETLYLTVYIVDRFLSIKAVQRKELQLVGISSMLLACKYEEIWAPEVNNFVNISANAYVRKEILVMEKQILGKLEWHLTVPTLYVFLVRYIKASESSDEQMENMVYFLAELGLMHYPTMVSHCPSMIAASSVYAARCTLDKFPSWTGTLEHHTGYLEEQLMECSKILVSLHHAAAAADNKLKAVYRKFKSSDHCAVALLSPAEKINGNSFDFHIVYLV